MKTLGERLRELREEKDWSLRELAKKVGLTAPFLSDVELGRRFPKEENLREIARVLGISVDEFRNLDTRPPIEELRRQGAADPVLGLALRQMLDRKVSGEELLKLLDDRKNAKKK